MSSGAPDPSAPVLPQPALPQPVSDAPMQVIPLRHPWTWAASVLVVLVAAGVAWSVTTNTAFQWPVVAQYLFDGQILAGLLRTLELTVAAMSLGLVLGTALAIMRLSDNKLLSVLSWLYIWFFRSVPVLVQLIFWYNFGALYAHVTLALPWGPVLYSASTNDVITPLTAALAGLGLLDDALALDLRKPQDYFHRVWSTAFRANDLAAAESDDGAADDRGQPGTGENEHGQDAKAHA